MIVYNKRTGGGPRGIGPVANKRFYVFWMIGVLALGQFACALTRGTEVLGDPEFTRGFVLSATNTNVSPRWGAAMFSGTSAAPVWRIAQWGTRFDLQTAETERTAHGLRRENEGKRVALHETDAGRSVEFAIYAGNEYAGRLRKQGEDWPHLLLSQDIATHPKLNDMKNFTVTFDIKIHKPLKKYDGEFDPRLHTAQYVMFFTLQDRNKKSPGYGDYLWFGIPIYDARYEFPKEYKAVDSGKADATQKFIYVVSGTDFWDRRVDDGEWRRFEHDVIPHMRKAVREAQSKGYLKNTSPGDIALGSMNTGWEVTGNYDVSSEFRNFSARADFIK